MRPGRSRNEAAEAMRAPGSVLGRRLGFGGGGEPDDEAGSGRNRRLRIEPVPDRHLAAAVEQVHFLVGKILRRAVPREICNGERMQRLGAVDGRIMRRTVEAMNE
jgi:hypothetical protein